MRRGSAPIVCLMFCTILCAAPLFADSTTEDLQSKIIERFDAPSSGTDANSKYEYPQNHRWIVRGSKFITQGFPKVSWVKTYPDALAGSLNKDTDNRSLGVQAAFDRTGYNYLEFVPVQDKDGSDGKPVEVGIPIPGRVKLIDFWVWGSNYNYYIEVQVRDWRGMVHAIKAGDLNFNGWRNLKVEIPPGIPQDVSYAPSRKGLELVKIVLWTRPEEKVNGFYVYLDQIKVLTDMFENPFDGSKLVDQTNLDMLWNGGSTPIPATK